MQSGSIWTSSPSSGFITFARSLPHSLAAFCSGSENLIRGERGYSRIGTFEGAIMHIWAAIMQKGGAGRTVLTVNLACHAAKQGFTTLVINLDRQPPLHAWLQARLASEIPNGPLPVISASMGELPCLLEEAARHGGKLLIIDTAPHVKREIIE